MKISESSNVPDSTYFRTGDAEPKINADGSITIYNGNGTHRGWGTPGVTSTVVYKDCDLVAIHVGFHHKHGGSQFWRYYTTDGTETRQIAWAKLADPQREAVLAAYEEKAPNWANVPGKLRTQYAKPTSKTVTAYKLVRMFVSGEMCSLYDYGTEYVIGKRLAQAARPDHNGGYYAHPSIEQVKALYHSGNLVPADCLKDVRTLALLKVEMGGTIIHYANGKMAATYCTPIEVLETIEIGNGNSVAA